MSDRHDQAQQILSEAHDDPASVETAKLAAARKHAERCPRCKAFQAGLERIEAADRAERAPAGLAERIVAAATSANSAGPAGVKPVDAPTSLAGRSHRVRARIPRLAWGLAAAAAVAAIFVGARLAVTSGVAGRSPSLTAAAPESAPSVAGSTDPAQKSDAVPGAQEPLYAPSPNAHPSAAGRASASGFVPSPFTALPVPVLLSFDGDVWGFSGWLVGTSPTLLVKVGTVRASLGGSGGPVPRAIYERVGDTSERYIVWSSDDYQIYRPLSRVISGRRYRMTTAAPVRDWGVWPVWPRTAGTYPTSAAGLQSFGIDQYGAPAFAQPGIPVSKGLALPPDVGGAAPNPVPKWTWWRTVR